MGIVRYATKALARFHKRQFVVLQVQPTNSGLTTHLIPQTAVCGYFKSSLLKGDPRDGERGRSLDLNNPQTAVWSIFAKDSSACRYL